MTAETDLLRAQLRVLTSTVPKHIWSASINKTRDWKKKQEAAFKVLNSAKATEVQLQMAIRSMENA